MLRLVPSGDAAGAYSLLKCAFATASLLLIALNLAARRLLRQIFGPSAVLRGQGLLYIEMTTMNSHASELRGAGTMTSALRRQYLMRDSAGDAMLVSPSFWPERGRASSFILMPDFSGKTLTRWLVDAFWSRVTF
jgi:hypothetical protein